eukprot:406034-Pelagomonas_calceolata.AAC.2
MHVHHAIADINTRGERNTSFKDFCFMHANHLQTSAKGVRGKGAPSAFTSFMRTVQLQTSA